MKILITGIGCIGKSSLREKLALDFPDDVITIDMDYNREIPSDRNKVVIVESVHGLEENPQMFDKILYLLPPRRHPILWVRRAWAWFSTGIVDLSAHKGKMKRLALSNIPIILKILARNIFMSKRWIRADLKLIQQEISDKTYIDSSIEHGYRVIKSWVINFICKKEARWQ
ncbi:hypothetical protein ES703_107039 [subsurface metagenome]